MTESVHRVIAIDGPAASGKSSVARLLARRVGFAYVNSGAMYRAFTWHVLEQGVAIDDPAGIAHAAEVANIRCDLRCGESRIFIDDIDAAGHLRDDAVNRAVSAVSSVPRLREILGEHMRAYAREHDLVLEGRDIGSVVFPETPFKFYIDAAPELRARRRRAEGQLDEIDWRDRFDSSRSTAPLLIAADADVIDTSELSIEQVVAEILRRLRRKGLTHHAVE